MNKVLFVICAALILSVPSYAGQILVPEEEPTIQAAVDAALPGDTISVAPGEYMEFIVIYEKTDLTLLSRDRWEAVIFGDVMGPPPKADKQMAGGMIVIGGDNITIDGFVFLFCGYYMDGAKSSGNDAIFLLGGAVSVIGHSEGPTKIITEVNHVEIINNVFLLNFGIAGGAVNVYGSGGSVDDKYIGGYSIPDGYGIPVDVEIERNVFMLNFAGFPFLGGPAPKDEGFYFPIGAGGAVCIWTDEWDYWSSCCTGIIQNNLFRSNFAMISGGAIALISFADLGIKGDGFFPVDVDIINNTIVDNWAGYEYVDKIDLEGLQLPEGYMDLLKEMVNDYEIMGESENLTFDKVNKAVTSSGTSEGDMMSKSCPTTVKDGDIENTFTHNDKFTLLSEGFEGLFPPSGWTVIDGSSSPGYQPAHWRQSDPWSYYHTGLYGALCPWGYDLDEWLITPDIYVGGLSGLFLSFWWKSSWYWHVVEDHGDLFVKISTDGGITWDNLWTFGDSADVVNSGGTWPWYNWQWYKATLDLSPYLIDKTIGDNIMIAFNAVADDNADIAIDDVVLGTDIPAGGVYILFSESEMKNNIIAWNSGCGVCWDFPFWWLDKKSGYPVDLTYSDLYENGVADVIDPFGAILMDNNIFQDPLVNMTWLQLTWGSPCIDAGDPDPSYNDWDGSRNDMGCYGGQTRLEIVTWIDLHTGWNLASVPAILLPPYDVPESDHAWGDDLPTKAVNTYGYDEGTGAYFYPSYVGFPSGYPAGGYMLGNFTADYADVMGTPIILPHEIFVSRTYPNPYIYGWNLIGNPYPYWSMLTPKNGMYGAIHFDSLRLNNVNYVAQYFDGYQYLVFPGSWDGWIEAIMAFWVQVADPGLGSVTFPAQLFTPWTPPIKSTPMIADYSLPAICMSSNSEGDRENNSQVTWDWQLKLSLKSGDLVDEYNYVGMSDDWRALSVVEFIVPLDEYVMLYIPQGDAGFKHLKLENFEGTMNIPVEIELNTNNETVELSWEFEGDVSGYEFIITDESGNELKMADRSSYDIVNTSRKVADTDIEAILTNPVLLLNRKVPGEIRRFNVAVKKICTGIEGVDFTGIELISPNPFTTGTTIKFALIDVMDVSLLVYDASGRLVKRLVDEKLGAGHYSYRWDGRDEIGVRLPSGIYFYKMNAEEYEKMGKLVLLR